MSNDIMVIDTKDDSSTQLIWLQGELNYAGKGVDQIKVATIDLQTSTVVVDVRKPDQHPVRLQISFQDLEAINTTIQKMRQAFENYYKNAREKGEI